MPSIKQVSCCMGKFKKLHHITQDTVSKCSSDPDIFGVPLYKHFKKWLTVEILEPSVKFPFALPYCLA